jgi:adenosylmethionine-8-amino-7-oxononanoate aminotransferase
MTSFAKGVTSGYLPLGGVAVSGRVAEPFFGEAGGPVFRHGATYAGHATCCAAALANLDLLERDDLLRRGETMEGPLLDALAPLTAHDAVVEVRGGTGTLAAVEITGNPQAFAAAVRAQGVLVRALGSGVAVSPPLTATEDHFDQIATAIGNALEETA